MTNTAKSGVPATPVPLEIRRNAKNQIWSPVRKKWLLETPEETVRQEYLLTLVNEYGYTLEQIEEEVNVAGRGSGNARADFLIWRTAESRRNDEKPLIVVECKAENVPVDQVTYMQGANYAHYDKALFFVCHNSRDTRVFKVDHERRAPNYAEVENIPPNGATQQEIDRLMSELVTLDGKTFAGILHECHNVIRNREHLDPAAAFDEIAKVLFVKIGQERRMKAGRTAKNLFTAKELEDDRVKMDHPINTLFEQTKKDYRADRIFDRDERINLRHDTAVAIVRKLERYNLSDTSDDVKGIAFERFLGRTFRGDIGQYFTPRPIVDFMVQMLDPQPGEVICDPASGSGGFLIRAFQHVRDGILRNVDAQYEAFKAQTEADATLSKEDRARRLSQKYGELQEDLDQTREGSRLWFLSNRSIYGTDANERMARTSKMNMIMHGDGHGGVHHHNGLLNVNGIFEGRFDVILTNPPFGANVEPSDTVQDVELDEDVEREYEKRYGAPYRAARTALRAQKGNAIARLYQLPFLSAPEGRTKTVPKIKTELVFIERCLNLLKPGGRMGILLPEGVFNNPKDAPVREFVEDRAQLLAVVSLPQDTFVSAKASVKSSLLFARKRTEPEQAEYDAARTQAHTDARAEDDARPEVGAERARLAALIAGHTAERDRQAALARDKARSEPERQAARDAERRALADLRTAQKHSGAFEKARAALVTAAARQLLKTRLDYPVFMYEAEHVGITSTGDSDRNELTPGDLPAGVTVSALELYRQFSEDPTSFFA